MPYKRIRPKYRFPQSITSNLRIQWKAALSFLRCLFVPILLLLLPLSYPDPKLHQKFERGGEEDNNVTKLNQVSVIELKKTFSSEPLDDKEKTRGTPTSVGSSNSKQFFFDESIKSEIIQSLNSTKPSSTQGLIEHSLAITSHIFIEEDLVEASRINPLTAEVLKAEAGIQIDFPEKQTPRNGTLARRKPDPDADLGVRRRRRNLY